MSSAPLRFAGYELMSLLSTSLHAETWLVRGAEGAPARILKRALPSTAESASLAAHFRAEADLCLRVRHPGIAPALELGEERSLPYYVRHYVPGPTLAELRDDATGGGGPLSPGLVAWIGLGIARALEHLHALGGPRSALQDLHPGNVVLGLEGQVWLIDLGGFRWWAEDTPRVFAPAYASPEQRARGDLRPATDWFSLGLILAELALGRRFSSEEGPAEWTSGELPSGLDMLLRAMLAPRPDARPGGAVVRSRLTALAIADEAAATALSRSLRVWHEGSSGGLAR